MVIITKPKKGKRKHSDSTKLRKLVLYRDKVSPIYTYTCPICKSAKAITKDDIENIKGKDVIVCDNYDCKKMFEIIYDEVI